MPDTLDLLYVVGEVLDAHNLNLDLHARHQLELDLVHAVEKLLED